jgi:hypothetical protein
LAKCPNCQKRSLFLDKVNCLVCGKVGCKNCFKFLFRIGDEYQSKMEDTYVCSEGCFASFAKQIEDQIEPKEINVEDELPPFHFFVGRYIFNPNRLSKLNPRVQSHIDKKKRVSIQFSLLDYPILNTFPENPLWQRLWKNTQLIKAKHFETLREFENAAQIYRGLGMYEEAGRVRAKRDELTVKKTDISLNLNALLQQVKDGGIVAIYRCPHCNGKLKIGNKSTLNSLRTCEHCGSEIEALDLADFLKTVLS